MPNGSMCLSGLKVTRPSRRAVLSPQRSAIQPCAASWKVIAITTGRNQTESAWPMLAMSMAQTSAERGLESAPAAPQGGLPPRSSGSGGAPAPARGARAPLAPSSGRLPPAPRPSRRSARCSAGRGRSRRRAPPPRARRARRSSAPMLRSSLSRAPAMPSSPRITSPITRAESVAGSSGSSASKRTCAVIAKGAARQVRNGCQSVAAAARLGLDHRQAEVAVGAGAAVARQMLDHRQHAAGEEALDQRAAELADQRGIGGSARSPIAACSRAARDRAPARSRP